MPEIWIDLIRQKNETVCNHTSMNTYNPDHITPPGDTLQDLLQERGMTQSELAMRSGFSRAHISDVVHGGRLTHSFALALERVFGVPASFWNTRELTYRHFLARQKSQ